MDLAFLHPLYEHSGSWASVYVDTSRQTASTPGERHLTASSLVRRLAKLGADEATRSAVRTAVENPPHSPEPRGRALFARSGEVVLDPPLARSPAADTAEWGPLPRVTPLLELAEEDPVCLVAYVGREGAEFELRSGLGREEAGSVTGRGRPEHRVPSAGPRPAAHGPPSDADRSGRHVRPKAENLWERDAVEIADALAACQEETRADLLILVGDGPERRAVYEGLPSALLDRVAQLSHGSGGRLRDEEVEAARAGHARGRAGGELERFRAARASGGPGGGGAVEGVLALVEAAREHRIDELLIRADGPDTHRRVWIGEDPDQLAVSRTELRAPGERHFWAARADDALIRSAVAAGAPVLLVTEAGEETPAGGLGALLRRT